MRITLVRYERKVNLGNYESEMLSLEAVVDETDVPEEVIERLRQTVLNETGRGEIEAPAIAIPQKPQIPPVPGIPETGSNGFPSNPMAAHLGDLITAKQLGMIKAIAREIGMDADEECRSLLQCTTDELSKRAASEFIKHLQDIERKALGRVS